jgi:hypothetical protein
MILDFLPHINNFGDNLVRLYDFDKKEAIKFAGAVKLTIVDSFQVLDLSKLDFIDRKEDINLIMRLAYENEGIRSNDNKTFYCDLTLEGFEEILRLIKPFCEKDTRSHEYLYDVDSNTDLLFSPMGTWEMEI